MYFPRSSRSVRLANSSRWRLISETVVIVGGPERGPLAGGLRYRLMRITFVSAHYPPNFVSGGTLQPQRLARALHDRGHDVAVFAGYLDSTRRPLTTWEEDDGTGLPVRWVVSTPYMELG